MSFSDENSDEDQTLVVRKEKKETRVNPMIQRVIRGLFFFLIYLYFFDTCLSRIVFFCLNHCVPQRALEMASMYPESAGTKLDLQKSKSAFRFTRVLKYLKVCYVNAYIDFFFTFRIWTNIFIHLQT